MTPGERLSLDAFIARAAPRAEDDLADALARLHGIADHLTAHLNREPGLSAQVAKFRTALPESLATAPRSDRETAVTEATQIAADIKQRWIEAGDPPLVDEIDDHLAEIAGTLPRLRRPGTEALREAAARIDRLGRIGAGLEGVEQRYLPWVLGAGVLFVIGLLAFALPSLVSGVPLLDSFWTVLLCLSALPAVGIHYARKVLPRSRADAEIDALNRTHFVPLGGIYFPEGTLPAAVITVAPPPEPTESEQARDERRRHREKLGPLW